MNSLFSEWEVILLIDFALELPFDIGFIWQEERGIIWDGEINYFIVVLWGIT